MPYESFAIPLGEVVTILGVIAAQAFGLWKIIDGRFRRLEDALQTKVSERRAEMAAMAAAETERAEALGNEITRVDRDVTALRVRVDSLPTKDQMEAMLDKRVDKLEAKFDRLYTAIMRPSLPRADTGD